MEIYILGSSGGGNGKGGRSGGGGVVGDGGGGGCWGEMPFPGRIKRDAPSPFSFILFSRSLLFKVEVFRFWFCLSFLFFSYPLFSFLFFSFDSFSFSSLSPGLAVELS